jgi:negative regulator of sigma-B (phosphoserine phosphatase)
MIDWGAAGAALDDAPSSGDLAVVAEFEGGALVGLIDGLGHGPEAAEAASAAREVLEEDPALPVADLVTRCHEALRRTRGAVMSLASFAASGHMTWVGVGNVDAVLYRAEAGPARAREALVVRGGVVGYQLPTLHARTLAVAAGDTLVMATDGIRTDSSASVSLEWSARTLAERIFERHASGLDDALVLVARYLGAGGAP